VLPESSTAVLANQLHCLKVIALEVIIITTTGDTWPSRLSGTAQMQLAAERANVLRRSFLELGIPDDRIYTEAQAMVAMKTLPRPSDSIVGAAAKIEYMGNCQGEIQGADCWTLCKTEQ